MGLIAREIESRGIPTLSLSSARSITASVNPPRAVYLDYPLGHTAGKPGAPDEQLAIARAALRAFEELQQPGEMRDLPWQWQEDDAWKDGVMRPEASSDTPADEHRSSETSQHTDDRVARHNTPQYQTEADALAADAHCVSCVFLQDNRPR